MNYVDTSDPEVDENTAVQGVVDSATTLFEYLSTALALSRDPALVRTLRISADAVGQRVLFAFGEHGPFLYVVGDNVERCTIGPPRYGEPHAGAPVVDLRKLFAAKPAAYKAVANAQERAGVLPEVAGWLRALSSGADSMSRETFREIARFQPLLAIEAYRQLTHASMALDVQRRELLVAASEGELHPATLQSYWALIHLIGNSALLATMGDEHTWLTDMVPHIPPGNWTPSFVLVRERLQRLGLRAGFVAAAFGETVVPRYLGVLAPGVVPLRAFDAVLGLTAIGVRHPHRAEAILDDIHDALAFSEAAAAREHAHLFSAMRRSAELVLGGGSRPVLDLVRLDGDDDCALVEDGLFPCILAQAELVRGQAEALFPPAENLAARTSGGAVHDRARAVLLRTGVVSSSLDRNTLN